MRLRHWPIAQRFASTAVYWATRRYDPALAYKRLTIFKETTFHSLSSNTGFSYSRNGTKFRLNVVLDKRGNICTFLSPEENNVSYVELF